MVFVIVCVNSIPAHSQPLSSPDPSFVRAFLTRHEAILLPRPGYFTPGDVVDSRWFQTQATLSECLNKSDSNSMQLLISPYAPLATESTYESKAWQTTLTVKAGSGLLSGETQIKVIRQDNVENSEDFVPRQRKLQTGLIFGSDIMRPECAGFYDNSDSKILDGSYLVLNELYSLSGKLAVTNVLSFKGDAKAIISSDSFLKKAKSISWLRPILKYFTFDSELGVGGGVKKSVQHELYYPTLKTGEDYVSYGFHPRYIRAWLAEEVLNEVRRSPIFLSGALIDRKTANVFLKEYPDLDMGNEDGALRQLFNYPDAIEYDVFLREYKGAKEQIDAVSAAINVNQIAGRFDNE